MDSMDCLLSEFDRKRDCLESIIDYRVSEAERKTFMRWLRNKDCDKTKYGEPYEQMAKAPIFCEIIKDEDKLRKAIFEIEMAIIDIGEHSCIEVCPRYYKWFSTVKNIYRAEKPGRDNVFLTFAEKVAFARDALGDEYIDEMISDAYGADKGKEYAEMLIESKIDVRWENILYKIEAKIGARNE